jgi:uncharacterized membrane protein YbhN (UPF0104 family)
MSAMECARRSHGLTVACSVAVGIALAAALAHKGDEFTAALGAAPAAILAAAIALQLLALLVRTEAWHLCVRSAGGTMTRRPLYRASSMGFLGSLVTGQLSVAARIAALRRFAPTTSPRVPALIAAEVPILAVEATLAALTSFTLVGPLGLPWWLPLCLLAVMVGASAGLRRAAVAKGRGFWAGLHVLRALRDRNVLVALLLVAVIAQIARNWLLLHAVGVDASVFDAIAVLIALVSLSQLPVGPGVGAAAAVLILGPHGVAAAAAAGVLLTATGTAGGLLFFIWAVLDRFALRPAVSTATALAASLAALPSHHRRAVEVAYFGGLTHIQIARALGTAPA